MAHSLGKHLTTQVSGPAGGSVAEPNAAIVKLHEMRKQKAAAGRYRLSSKGPLPYEIGVGSCWGGVAGHLLNVDDFFKESPDDEAGPSTLAETRVFKPRPPGVSRLEHILKHYNCAGIRRERKPRVYAIDEAKLKGPFAAAFPDAYDKADCSEDNHLPSEERNSVSLEMHDIDHHKVPPMAEPVLHEGGAAGADAHEEADFFRSASAFPMSPIERSESGMHEEMDDYTEHISNGSSPLAEHGVPAGADVPRVEEDQTFSIPAVPTVSGERTDTEQDKALPVEPFQHDELGSAEKAHMFHVSEVVAEDRTRSDFNTPGPMGGMGDRSANDVDGGDNSYADDGNDGHSNEDLSDAGNGGINHQPQEHQLEEVNATVAAVVEAYGDMEVSRHDGKTFNSEVVFPRICSYLLPEPGDQSNECEGTGDQHVACPDLADAAEEEEKEAGEGEEAGNNGFSEDDHHCHDSASGPLRSDILKDTCNEVSMALDEGMPRDASGDSSTGGHTDVASLSSHASPGVGQSEELMKTTTRGTDHLHDGKVLPTPTNPLPSTEAGLRLSTAGDGSHRQIKKRRVSWQDEMEKVVDEPMAAEIEGHAVQRKEEVSNCQKRKSKRRNSLRGFGTCIENGVRRSTRQKLPPLQYWRNEHVVYHRVHTSLPTIMSVALSNPNPEWPLVNRRTEVTILDVQPFGIPCHPAICHESSDSSAHMAHEGTQIDKHP